MECASRYEWGLFGSLFFFAGVVGSIILTPFADWIGRRKILIIGLIIQALSMTALLLTKSPYLAYTLVFLIGLAVPPRQTVGFIYCMEFLPIKSTALATAITLGIDNLGMLWASLYFLYISRDWQWFFMAGTVVSWFTLAWVCLLPESPQYLINKHKFDEARKVLTTMAK